MEPTSDSTMQDLRGAGDISQLQQTDNASIPKDINDPASTPGEAQTVDHERQEMADCPRDGGEGGIEEKAEHTAIEKYETGQAEKEMEAGEKELHAIKSENNDDTTGPATEAMILLSTLPDEAAQIAQLQEVQEDAGKMETDKQEPEDYLNFPSEIPLIDPTSEISLDTAARQSAGCGDRKPTEGPVSAGEERTEAVARQDKAATFLLEGGKDIAAPIAFSNNTPSLRHSTGHSPIHNLSPRDFTPHRALTAQNLQHEIEQSDNNQSHVRQSFPQQQIFSQQWPSSQQQLFIQHQQATQQQPFTQQPFAQRNHSAQYPQPTLDPRLRFRQLQMQLQVQIAEKRRQTELIQRQYLEKQLQIQQPQIHTFDMAQNQPIATPPFLMGPLSYQRAPQGGYHCSHPQPQQLIPPSYHPQQQQQQQNQPEKDHRGAVERQQQEESDDDDEPLKTRVKRHASTTTSPTLSLKSEKEAQKGDMGSSSGPTTTATASTTTFNWKLPEYDVERQRSTSPTSLPSAKVSLPGLIREELLLSPDHADQEIHLLLNVFLPAQRALPTPDPEPALAILNFHTIALMVVEAFVQFEIGDEVAFHSHMRDRYPSQQTSSSAKNAKSKGKASTTKGKGKAKKAADEDSGVEEEEEEEEDDYIRRHSSSAANPDEIFFAVLDRWRAGLESNKKNYQLIRGIQEFCDVALDVIFYVKENGLLGREGQDDDEEQEQVHDRDGEGEGVAKKKEKEKGKGVKRPAAKKSNEVQARKKAKVVGGGGGEEGKKKRRKTTPGITVVKR